MHNKKLSFFFATILRLLALSFVLTTISLTELRLSSIEIIKIYSLICLIYSLSLFSVMYRKYLVRLSFYIPIQIALDIFLATYLVIFTGVNSSIFVSLYIINIAIATIGYRLFFSMATYCLVSSVYALMYFFNANPINDLHITSFIYHEFYFFLVYVLSLQLKIKLKTDSRNILNSKRNYNHLKLLTGRLIDNLSTGIMHIDEDDNIISVNRAFTEIFGIEALPANKKVLYYDIVSELKGIRGKWFRLTKKQQLKYIIKIKLKNKKNKDILLRVIEMKKDIKLKVKENNTKRAECLFVFEDVSELKDLEEQLNAESKIALMGRLAAGIAHEIRTPLASISGAVETIARKTKSIDVDDRQLVSITVKEVRRLDKLIQEFLDYAKISCESSNLELPLKDILDEVIKIIKCSSTRMKLVNFNVDIQPELKVIGNSDRLKQVFFNLFTNSIEANKNKEINISIYSKVSGKELAIEIKDDGVGIPDEIINRVFEPFATTKKEGTGLGLSSVEKIIKDFDGQISAIPSRKGAFFEIIFSKNRYKIGVEI